MWLKVKLHSFLTSALDGSEWLVSRRSPFISEEKVPHTNFSKKLHGCFGEKTCNIPCRKSSKDFTVTQSVTYSLNHLSYPCRAPSSPPHTLQNINKPERLLSVAQNTQFALLCTSAFWILSQMHVHFMKWFLFLPYAQLLSLPTCIYFLQLQCLPSSIGC